MFTVNLEKELLKANKKLILPSELLYIKEYEKNPGIVENEAMTRIGLSQGAAYGKQTKDHAEAVKAQTAKFKQERVFHISQIEDICTKYHLRFLPSLYYSGAIDKELPYKISNFEAAYEVQCKCEVDNRPDPVAVFRMGREYPANLPEPVQNTFIMAPASSFSLQEKPKDPLLFYKINDEYYYLIHKWGNDLNILNRLKGVFSKWWTCFLAYFSSNFLCVCFLVCTPLDLTYTRVILGVNVGVCVYNIILLFVRLANDNLRCYIWFDNSEWRSKYL